MEFTLKGQIFNFFIFFIFGVILSAVLDILRILESVLASRHKSSHHNVRDISFFIISSLLSYLLTLALNNGELCAYIFIAELLGYIAWHNTFSKNFLSFLKKIVKKLKKPILVVLKFLKEKTQKFTLPLKNKATKILKQVIDEIKLKKLKK